MEPQYTLTFVLIVIVVIVIVVIVTTIQAVARFETLAMTIAFVLFSIKAAALRTHRY